MAPNVHLTALGGSDCSVRRYPLGAPSENGTWDVLLRCLPGASAIFVEVSDDAGELRCRAELQAISGDTVPLRLRLRADGTVSAEAENRAVFSMPLHDRYQPLPPLRRFEADSPLDVAILVDRTTLTADGDQPRSPERRLLADAKRWGDHVQQLVALVSELSQGRLESRVAILAFGDRPVPNADAPDLQPDKWLVLPDERDRRFLAFNATENARSLQDIPWSSGADFVDALGDGLRAASKLNWRRDALKLLVVSGDSPGHSLVAPCPAGGDAQLREYDVDSEALGLHSQGIVVATIFHARVNAARDDSAPPDQIQTVRRKEFLDYAQRQYLMLASREELAFRAERFSGSDAARLVASHGCGTGRGPAYGIWMNSVDRAAGA